MNKKFVLFHKGRVGSLNGLMSINDMNQMPFKITGSLLNIIPIGDCETTHYPAHSTTIIK